MIIYSGSKFQFICHVDDNDIDEVLEEALRTKMHRSAAHGEVVSWRNSLTFMANVLRGDAVPDDAGVALEYNIPHTAKRVDMIVSGSDASRRRAAVIVELKQWESAEAVEGKDAIVRTLLGGSMAETTHPSYQALSYARMIEDFNGAVQDSTVSLHPCAYLHNYRRRADDPLFCDAYSAYIESSPLFLKSDAAQLRGFIGGFVVEGDPGCETIGLIDSGRLRPSKSLQDCLRSMLEGAREFTLIDTQKVVYEHILHRARGISGRKKVIIVEGGPGTGKSVLAVNLLVELTGCGLSASYVTKNSAPREVYLAKLRGSMKKSRIDFLFKGSGAFVASEPDAYDVLLVDEAHRLNEKSGLFRNLGENQIAEIIASCRLPVFFIDETQRVTLNDIGTVAEIKRRAELAGAEVETLHLDSQFRCDGSDGYLSWLDDVLGIRGTANFDYDAESYRYDFRVFDDPDDLRAAIVEKNAANGRSRIVAGYCWDWVSGKRDDPSVHDIKIPGTGFEMSWNLKDSEQPWAIGAGSVDQVGCIHTCQGLEFDYVGVIIGDDLRYEGGVVTDYTKRAKDDRRTSLWGLKKMYRTEEERRAASDPIIRNTYKVLLSRGMKGCYVYCTDRKLARYLRERSARVRDGARPCV